jgi:hypothetical protein
MRGETPELEATVESQELGPFRIRSPASTGRPGEPSWFTVTTSSGPESKASRRHVVSIKVDATAAIGKQYGDVELETDTPQGVKIQVPVGARIRPHLELRFRDRDVEVATTLLFGVLRRNGDPLEIVVRDTRAPSVWQPGEATVTVTRRGGVAVKGGDAATDPKFEIETTSGSTDSERRIRLRLLEARSSTLISGDLRLPLHHPDLDELVLHWTAFCRDQ